jgi:hypothetical protein
MTVQAPSQAAWRENQRIVGGLALLGFVGARQVLEVVYRVVAADVKC